MKFLLVLTVALLAIVCGEEDNKDKTNEVLDYKDSDTEELLNWEAPLELQKEYPYYLSGFDDDDAPIWVAEMGIWDTRKNVENGPEREKNFRKYVLQFLKRCQESTKLRSTPDNPVKEFNIIVDMAGYSIRQAGNPATIGLTLWMARQYEQAFRESMKLGIIINGNYIFTTIWQLMRPILGANVYKIDVFGSNSERFIPRLLKVFPKDQLPSWYGGTKDHKPVKIYG